MLYRYQCSIPPPDVPRITVVLRKAFGRAAAAMGCSATCFVGQDLGGEFDQSLLLYESVPCDIPAFNMYRLDPWRVPRESSHHR